jgi:hypothetical protein
MHIYQEHPFFSYVLYSFARGLHFSSFSYPRIYAWVSGVIIFYLAMLAAFTGYITMGTNELLGSNSYNEFINRTTLWGCFSCLGVGQPYN